MISAVRGAICVKKDEKALIEDAVAKVYGTLLRENVMCDDDIAAILFTVTSDLRSRNPAGALRNRGYAEDVPLFCMQEAEIEGMMPRVIRVLLVLKETKGKMTSVYLDGAEALRPDLQKEKGSV